MEETENIKKLPKQENIKFSKHEFVLRVWNEAQGTREIADFNKPVDWKDIDKHKLLSNKNNDLLFV